MQTKKKTIGHQSTQQSRASIIRYRTINPSIQRSQDLAPLQRKGPQKMLPEEIQSHKYQRLVNVLDQRSKIASLLVSPSKSSGKGLKLSSLKLESNSQASQTEMRKKIHRFKTQESSGHYQLQHLNQAISSRQLHIKFPQLNCMKQALHIVEKKAPVSFLLDTPNKSKPYLKSISVERAKKISLERLNIGQFERKKRGKKPCPAKRQQLSTDDEVKGWTMLGWQF